MFQSPRHFSLSGSGELELDGGPSHVGKVKPKGYMSCKKNMIRSIGSNLESTGREAREIVGPNHNRPPVSKRRRKQKRRRLFTTCGTCLTRKGKAKGKVAQY